MGGMHIKGIRYQLLSLFCFKFIVFKASPEKQKQPIQNGIQVRNRAEAHPRLCRKPTEEGKVET
jgi:hypothetical protein